MQRLSTDGQPSTSALRKWTPAHDGEATGSVGYSVKKVNRVTAVVRFGAGADVQEPIGSSTSCAAPAPVGQASISGQVTADRRDGQASPERESPERRPAVGPPHARTSRRATGAGCGSSARLVPVPRRAGGPEPFLMEAAAASERRQPGCGRRCGAVRGGAGRVGGAAAGAGRILHLRRSNPRPRTNSRETRRDGRSGVPV